MLVGEIEKQHDGLDPGVVNQNVNWPEILSDPLHHCLDLGPVRDVSRHSHRATAPAADRGRHILRPLPELKVVDGDVGALVCEHLGDAFADDHARARAQFFAEVARRHGMRRRWEIAWVAAVLLVAAGLRITLLGGRPMHADEAILADKFGTMLAGGGFTYDPREYHGPVLEYLAWIPARLTGRTNYEALTETTLRIAPAVCGILLALSPLLLAPALGVTAAMSAAALVAVSPALVYYSRDFIPEMPLALWTALFLAGMCRSGVRWRVLAGLAAGAMIATKETATLALAAAALAYAATVGRPRSWRGVTVFAGAAVGALVLLVGPGTLRQIGESLAAYGHKAVTGGPHDHPWYTYWQWMAGWHYGSTEAPILILAAAGLAAAVKIPRAFPRFFAVYTLALAFFYSALPYKTPWCAVSILFGLSLLAGVGVAALESRRRAVAPAAVIAAIAILASQDWRAAAPYAADPRNPWAYAQTGAGVFTIRDRVDEFVRASPEGRAVTLDVYTRENFWPLPWYFRRYSNVRWWRQVGLEGRAAGIILVSPEMEPDVVRKLYQAPPPGERELYMNLFTGYVELRPQVEVRGYVAKSLWDRAQ